MAINKVKSHPISNNKELSANVSLDKLQTIVMFLTTKYAQTKDVKFAEAAYQHLCLINDHSEADPELKFFCQSLVMDWRSIVWKQGLVGTKHS